MCDVTRQKVLSSTALLFCLAASSCEPLLGSVDVGSAPEIREPAPAPEVVVAPVQPVYILPPISAGGAPEAVAGNPVLAVPSPDAGAAGKPAPVPEAPPVQMQPDAGPAAPAPTAVLVEGPVSELVEVGIAGGKPRLCVCEGGVAIGVRPTANPSLEVFGQRLTFIEPLCGKVSIQPSATLAAPAQITVVRDDSLASWAVTDPFQGLPPTEVPDPRLTWVPQPATLCPEAAPVLVGLSGEYDPVAPDDSASAAIRSLVIECAPLVLASDGSAVSAAVAGHQRISQEDSFAIPGTASYESRCEGGSVVTQIHVDSGFWLDGFMLGCAGLQSL
jgi:hypothetical protein